jgi:hypothetical protein
MVGRVGVEPTTSRLSGVRSNHLSYRPHCTLLAPNLMTRRVAAGGEGQLRLSTPHDAVLISRMKGHEDDGMFFGADEALPIATIQPLPAG